VDPIRRVTTNHHEQCHGIDHRGGDDDLWLPAARLYNKYRIHHSARQLPYTVVASVAVETVCRCV
jgi:hypothetical protein